MTITRLEAIWFNEQPNKTWVRMFTNLGLIELRRTIFSHAERHASTIHI
jgi:hypothetical protein